MAGLRADEAAAQARVAAAKLRLLQLAREAERPPAVVAASSALVRAHPWRGVAVAFVAGVALGMAPRGTLARVAPLLAPVLGMLPTSVAPRGAGGPSRPGGGL